MKVLLIQIGGSEGGELFEGRHLNCLYFVISCRRGNAHLKILISLHLDSGNRDIRGQSANLWPHIC